MNRVPWSEIVREAHRWRVLSSEQRNERTLSRIENAQRYRNLLRDVTNLAVVESLNPEKAVLPNDAIKIPCPICKSKEFLVEGFAHSKILICERPNCVYTRAKSKMREQKLSLVEAKVVNE